MFTDKNNNEKSKAKVGRVDNNIIYTGPIDTEGSHEFQKRMLEYISECKLKQQMPDAPPCEPLNIHITSGGGKVNDGIAMMNTIASAKETIKTKCISKGFVGSAATYAAFECDERCAGKNTMFLLHPPSKSGVSGQTDDIQISAENLQKTHNNILDIYNTQSSQKTPDNFNVIESIFKTNKYSSGLDMQKIGLIDKIE
jgi:ATP-dependent protease ClpP protease subunit